MIPRLFYFGRTKNCLAQRFQSKLHFTVSICNYINIMSEIMFICLINPLIYRITNLINPKYVWLLKIKIHTTGRVQHNIVLLFTKTVINYQRQIKEYTVYELWQTLIQSRRSSDTWMRILLKRWLKFNEWVTYFIFLPHQLTYISRIKVRTTPRPSL